MDGQLMHRHDSRMVQLCRETCLAEETRSSRIASRAVGCRRGLIRKELLQRDLATDELVERSPDHRLCPAPELPEAGVLPLPLGRDEPLCIRDSPRHRWRLE
jgi:hypothetical protein